MNRENGYKTVKKRQSDTCFSIFFICFENYNVYFY